MQILFLIGFLGTGFLIFRYVKYKKKISKKVELLLLKIKNIDSNITKEIRTTKDKIYYKNLRSYYNNLKNDIKNNSTNKVSKSNIEDLNKKINSIDSIYVNLKQNIRILDNFELFNDGFSNTKRKYRTSFKSSVCLLDDLKNTYGDIIVKYLTKFNSDYNSYKENEIRELNKLVKESFNFYNDFEIEKLKDNYYEMTSIDSNIKIQIEEPIRLKDKFVKSEINIEQLSTDLENKKGSLYHKVFNVMKIAKVNKEETEEWNRIKRTINNFRKSSLLKKDVIELSNTLNKIIQNLSDLNYSIKNHENYVKVVN